MSITRKSCQNKRKKTLVRAQDASRVIDLHHLVVLISSPITAGCNRNRVLIDNLGRPISDLGRLVSQGQEVRRKLRQRGLRRCIELGDHLPSRLPEKGQVSFRVFPPNIVNKCADTVIEALPLDLLELSRGLILEPRPQSWLQQSPRDSSQLSLSVLSPSLQLGDLHQGVLLILRRCL